jgi:serine O-acetyltransferase
MANTGNDHRRRAEAWLNDETVLPDVVERLCGARDEVLRRQIYEPSKRLLPARATLIEIVEALRTVLFPGYFGTTEIGATSMPFYVGATLDRVMRLLREQILRGLCSACTQERPDCSVCDERTNAAARTFLERLPEVRRLLATDVIATYEGDPAATGHVEAIICYPGILALTNHRLAHELYKLGIPLLPRIITEHAHSICGIDIHPGAQIGEKLFIDHGTGVVIGETTVIGNSVRIYQGVTLGAKSFPLDDQGRPIKGIARHPIVEDEVIIYGGATILGRVTIGRGSVIGGNVWLTNSLPPNSKVTQARARQDRYADGGGI